MPLSEHEQRILDEIERRLADEDPRFARSTSTATPRGVALRRIKRGAFGFGLGLVLLMTGLVVPELLVFFGLAAFAVMLASVVVVAKAAKGMGRVPVAARGKAKQPGWFDRMEDRWRKRFEQGDDRPS